MQPNQSVFIYYLTPFIVNFSKPYPKSATGNLLPIRNSFRGRGELPKEAAAEIQRGPRLLMQSPQEEVPHL